MSEGNIFIDAFAGIVTVGFAVVFFYYLWQQYVIDVTREQLFELRDRLFDIASEGKLDRNSESYRVLREMFNSGIRFTHRISLVQFIMVSRYEDELVRTRVASVQMLLDDIDNQDTRYEVQKLLNRMGRFLTLHLVKKSIFVQLLGPVGVLLYIAVSLGTQFFDKFRYDSRELINAMTYEEAIHQAANTQ
jgi:hypothetical protein